MSKKKTSTNKDSSNEGMLPKMELLIIFVFFLSFIIWAMSKCNSTQVQYEQEATKEEQTVEKKTIEKPEKKQEATSKQGVETKQPVSPPVKREKVTVLYVVLDGLKMRKGPHLDSSIVRTLRVDSEVYFLNDVTNFKQEINLGDRMAIEPWIKVRSYSGHEGWVYGAGVNYFKQKPIIDTLAQ